MQSVELEEAEWHQVLNCMTYAPMREAQPLYMRIIRQISRLSDDSVSRASHTGKADGASGKARSQVVS